MVNWVIERLNAGHQRGEFCCGKTPLDSFLKTAVTQYEKRGLGRTMVAVRPGEKAVVGFYTASTGSFALDQLPEAVRKKLPNHPIPTIHLGRLAVDKSCQGQGLGETLLFHFLNNALRAYEEFGVYAVDVWSMDEWARAFYLKYGFHELQDDALHLYMTMKEVARLLGREEPGDDKD